METDMTNLPGKYPTPRIQQLLKVRLAQPYELTLDGLNITVGEDVFPPDLGYTSQYLAQTLAKYSPTAALDMGCGTGYLAMVMKRQGASEVWALDIHPPAVACARANAIKNGFGDIHVEQSDLFEAISPSVKFDMIVFNQPYYPVTGEALFGLGPDGGSAIIERFMSQVTAHLLPGGVFLMPFSDMADEQHNPVPIAKQNGYSFREVFNHHDGTCTHKIYEFKSYV